MAQKQVQLELQTFACSICLYVLRQPVAVPCGHSYCKNCIKTHWNREEQQQKKCSCPQCRQTFTPRPVLVKNTMLAAVVDELKKTGQQGSPAGLHYGHGDVLCDFCTGKKLRATKSCLQCLVSYCDQHLQPHFTVAQFKKHKLVQPSKQLQENICSLHNEVMKMFCRTDQQLICRLCSLDQHKGHNTVSAAAERRDKQRELWETRRIIQQRIKDTEEYLKELQRKEEAIKDYGDQAMDDNVDSFNHMICLLQEKRQEVREQISSKQNRDVDPHIRLVSILADERFDLQEKDTELERLSQTSDHTHFLSNYSSQSALSPPRHSSSREHLRPLIHFEAVTASVAELIEKLLEVLRDNETNISTTESNRLNVLLSDPQPGPRPDQHPGPRADRPTGPQPEPRPRAEFLRYSQEITLDPDTANTHLLITKGNSRATVIDQHQSHPDHSDRFNDWCQVLSRESLNERCYFEVEWSGREVFVGVSSKDISRSGEESLIGNNEKSWSLACGNNHYYSCINKVHTPISGPPSSRVGVYLDRRAGLLSFYSVSETMTLLHRVQTTFTEPLYAGVCCSSDRDSAEIMKLK